MFHYLCLSVIFLSCCHKLRYKILRSLNFTTIPFTWGNSWIVLMHILLLFCKAYINLSKHILRWWYIISLCSAFYLFILEKHLTFFLNNSFNDSDYIHTHSFALTYMNKLPKTFSVEKKMVLINIFISKRRKIATRRPKI